MKFSDIGTNRKAFGFLVILICLFSLSAGEAGAKPNITVEPSRIGPGDIAVITVRKAGGPVEGSFNGKPLYFNSVKKSVKAVLGIDLTMEPGTYPLELRLKGKKIKRDIKIVQKEYPVQHLKLPTDKVELSPENEARADREQAKLTAIWPVDSERLWKGNFIDPLPGKPLGTPFGVRRIINDIPKNPHTGIDITADEGEPVHAPNDGKVALVDDHFFAGNSIILDHGQGIYTMFFHLSKIDVQTGQAIKKGDVIGLVGATGRATGAHLHWGARIQGARVNPQELLRLKLE